MPVRKNPNAGWHHSSWRLGILVGAFLTGCQRAPSVDIIGSFFPIWIFCIAIGIVLTLIARVFFIRTGLVSELGPLILVYPSLAALFAFVIWLVFFR